ncbi:hypothetical protein P3W45_000590 [Vairimorpha bombi]|jgi:hypothetical protein
MYLITKNKHIGKIYQVVDINKVLDLNPSILAILTFGHTEYNKIGILRDYSKRILCTTTDELIGTLRYLILNPEDCLIYSLSTVTITNKIYKCMQVLNSKGSDIFIHTFSNKKLWFTDLFIY